MYQIEELIIVNNHRLLNKGTREIHYTPKKPLQLLLGQNGFGKSTLLWELSPLPAVPADYTKGGYKHFVCTLNGVKFVLRSDFTKGNKHSFLKDGQELNVGGTITVQKQLVEAELGYTQDLHSLLIGNTRFTSMTAQKRKELFVHLCETDVSYAMRVFASAATNARNVVGAIKHNENKLVEATATLLDEETHQALSAQMAEFSEQISSFYTNKELGITFTQQDYAELQLLDAEVQRVSNDLLSTPRQDFEGCSNPSEYAKLVMDAESDIRNIQTQLQSLGSEFDNINNLLTQQDYAGEQTTEELVAELHTLELALSKLRVNPEHLALPDPAQIAMDALAVCPQFDSICFEIETNMDSLLYNRETVASSEAQHRQFQTDIDRALNKIRIAEEHMQHMKAGEQNTCPNCAYTWRPGFSELKYQQHEKTVLEAQTLIEQIQPELNKATEWLQKSQEWKSCFMRYRELVNNFPRLSYFWEQLSASNAVYNAPRSLVGTLERFGRQMLSVKDYIAIQQRIVLLTEVLEKRKLMQSSAAVSLSARSAALSSEIEQLTTALEDLKALHSKRSTILKSAQIYAQKSDQLTRLFTEYSRLNILRARVSKNELLDKAISEINQQSGLIASRLQKSISTIEIANHLKTSLQELQEDQEAYEILLNELSPTDGLIADSLIGFVVTFVKQLNRIIGMIWKSPLLVCPCDLDEGGLNYKFPVRMIDERPIDDVSQSSKGEKELIDFVFVIVAAHYLGVSHYPVFMDEVGASFSEQHRQSLFDYVKIMLDTKVTSQVFIVSHYAGTHGSLTHAEINIIDRTGVMVTPGANQNFKVV